VAHALLGQNVMLTFPARSAPLQPALSFEDRRTVLRFAASFLWADFEVADSERRFLSDLARELELDDSSREVEGLLAQPPMPEDIDPASVTVRVADVVRRAALRAIAADGHVDTEEMKMFELLDDLLPRT